MSVRTLRWLPTAMATLAVAIAGCNSGKMATVRLWDSYPAVAEQQFSSPQGAAPYPQAGGGPFIHNGVSPNGPHAWMAGNLWSGTPWEGRCYGHVAGNHWYSAVPEPAVTLVNPSPVTEAPRPLPEVHVRQEAGQAGVSPSSSTEGAPPPPLTIPRNVLPEEENPPAPIRLPKNTAPTGSAGSSAGGDRNATCLPVCRLTVMGPEADETSTSLRLWELGD